MHGNKKVLVVDDNPVNSAIVKEMLEGQYRVKCAQNGRDAIRMASAFEPGVILLDVMMPGMDGLEVCRRIRTMPGLSKCAIIMVSAKAMPSEQAAGVDAGADSYITKPFDDVELLETLRQYTDSGQEGSDNLADDDIDDRAAVVSIW